MSTVAATAVDVHPTLARIRRVAHVAYGVAAAGLGVLVLRAGSLAAVFQNAPRWLPLRHAIAYASAALLLAGGLALLARRTERFAALALTVNCGLVWLLLMNLPTTLAKPTVVGYWEGCGLDMVAAAGAWILLALTAGPSSGRTARLLGAGGVRLARRLFALGIPLVGLAHFADAPGATGYVPTWFPLRTDWVYLTGAGHVAAGLALLFGVVPLLAAVLEAGQITAFVIFAHIPSVYAAPGDMEQWAELVYAVALCASAWLVAATVRGASSTRTRTRRDRALWLSVWGD